MRILIDPAVYGMRNKGNIALLQVELERLARFWPEARIEIVTDAPQMARLYCPRANAVRPDGEAFAASWADRLPAALLRMMLEVREVVRQKWPRRASNGSAAEVRPGGRPADRGVPRTGWTEGLDLCVASGAQYMSDACRNEALRVLDRLEAAAAAGAVTAMLGQGIGPIHDPTLRLRAAAVLPRLDFIFIRDLSAGVPLLKSLGVDPCHIVFTADDAIELAYNARPPALGRAIGVGVRCAHYTAVGEDHIELIRHVMPGAAAKRRTKLEPLAISASAHERDLQVLRRITGRTPEWLCRLEPPLAVVRRAARCRIVVSASFHPAVFALAQGIPVVGLTYSEMYKGKFQGLAEQFGEGCRIVQLDDPEAGEKLLDAIDRAWESADRMRPELLRAAAAYIETGRAAYQRLREVVTARKAPLYAN